MKRRFLAGALVALPIVLLFYPPVTAWAQQETLITGQDSSGNTRAILTDTSGRIVTTANSAASSGTSSAAHGACTSQALTIGTTATNIPSTPVTARSFISIELSQAGETLDCEFDGSAVVSGQGLILEHRTIYSLNLAGNVNVSCLCSAASCSVRVVECP